MYVCPRKNVNIQYVGQTIDILVAADIKKSKPNNDPPDICDTLRSVLKRLVKKMQKYEIPFFLPCPRSVQVLQFHLL